MKKIIIFAMLVLLVILNSAYAANSLHVEKDIGNQNIKVGDDVSILLKFTNPFGEELPIKIVDKNILGNNGLDVQCLEYTIPSDEEATIAYDPIKPFESGQYTLGSVEISYTNPETGKEETVKSNTLDVQVKDSKAQQGQAQGITTIYRCNGVNMRSTSYSSSGSSFNVQIGGGSNLQQQFNQMPNQKQGSPQDRVQNNQMDQNTNAIKQQMEQQLQQQERMEKEFKQNLAKNNDFQKRHQQILEGGYNLTDASFDVKSNNTGSFELSYQKPNGETANLKGEMENKKTKNIMSLTAEDKQKMLDTLRHDKEFQKYHNNRVNNGFNQTQPTFNQISQNHTKITIPYTKGESENKIAVDYINGTIQNIQLENKESNGGINRWWLLLIPILGAICWFIYTKYFRTTKELVQEHPLEIIAEKPVDYREEAKRMLEKAKELFAEEREKDAYEKVSQSVRFYFSYKLNVKKEITNLELLNILQKKGTSNYQEIQKCLNMCSLVEFAKYKPNKEDFDEIIKIGERIII
jgi:HEPN domain-containing protein